MIFCDVACEKSFYSSVIVYSGDQGSPLQKHPKLEARLSGASLSSSSSKTMSLTPPPVLPPKTRKLVPGGQAGAGSSGAAQQQTAQQASSSSSSTTKRQHQLQPSHGHGSSLETEDRILPQERVSVVRIGAVPTSLSRSLSSVAATGARLRTRVAKPVRRSKSQLTGGKYVTNITHGGSVTLVSLNSQEEEEASRFQPIEGPETGPASAAR